MTEASLPLLPTSLVGSYPQPDWLIDRARPAGRFPPRVRARELWRIAPEFLAQAQDDAGTAVHLCFGYAAVVHDRPAGCSFLPELAGCTADHISIETAQSNLDLGVLADLSATGRLMIAPDCGMKYLPRVAAEGKMRAMSGAARLLRGELAAGR